MKTLTDAIQNDQSGAKLKFLRRIPVDPMTKSPEWGLRAYQDKPDAASWGRGSVFDVRPVPVGRDFSHFAAFDESTRYLTSASSWAFGNDLNVGGITLGGKPFST